MTRHEVERLLHCARHEAQGAGPNTLAEVCEWALITQAMDEGKLAKARGALRSAIGYVHRMHPASTTGECSDFVCRLIRAALSDEEPKP